MTTGTLEKSAGDIPQKVVKLGRRIAGLKQTRDSRRHLLELIILHDGTWLLIVDGSDKVECLGNE